MNKFINIHSGLKKFNSKGLIEKKTLLLFGALRLIGIIKDLILIPVVNNNTEVKLYLVIEPILYGLGFFSFFIFNPLRVKKIYNYRYLYYSLIIITSFFYPILSLFVVFLFLSFYEKLFALNDKIGTYWKLLVISNIITVLLFTIFNPIYYIQIIGSISFIMTVYVKEKYYKVLKIFQIRKKTSLPFIARPYIIAAVREIIFNSNISNYLIILVKVLQQISFYLSNILIGKNRNLPINLFYYIYILSLFFSVTGYFINNLILCFLGLTIVLFSEPLAVSKLKK